MSYTEEVRFLGRKSKSFNLDDNLQANRETMKHWWSALKEEDRKEIINKDGEQVINKMSEVVK